MKIGNKTGVEKSLSRETISAPEVLDNPGGPEPTLLAQNALALVSMGQHTGGPETAFDEVENRSYALRNVSSEAPPGWLTSNSPRSAGSLHGRRGRLANHTDFGDLQAEPFGSEDAENGRVSAQNSGTKEMQLVLANQNLSVEIYQGNYLSLQPVANAEQMNAMLHAILHSEENRSQSLPSAELPLLEYGHSEMLAICDRGAENTSGNPREELLGHGKHERENGSQDSGLSPKRTHVGESTPMECDGVEDHEKENDNQNYTWECWASWMEHQMEELKTENKGIHESVQNNCMVVESFTQHVQTSVQNTLGEYQDAIRRKFAEVSVESEVLKTNLVQECQKSATEFHVKAQNKVLELFSAHALENGHLWQGVVKAQSDHLEKMIHNRIDVEKVALENYIRDRVVQSVKPELVLELVPRLQEVKACVEKRLEESLGVAFTKIEESVLRQKALETEVGALREANQRLRETQSQREVAVDNGLCLCVREIQKLWRVNGDKNGQVDLEKLHEQMNCLTKEMGLARKEGKDTQTEVLSVPSSDATPTAKPGNPQVNPNTAMPSSANLGEPQVGLDADGALMLEPLYGTRGSPGVDILVPPEVLLECIMDEEVPLPDDNENVVELRPVEIGVGVPREGITLASLPIAAHLSRTQTAPKFSGKKQDWIEFLWKFDSWFRVITTGKPIGDAEATLALNSCLPENLQREMQLWEHERGRRPSYVEYRGYMEAKFGRAQADILRKKWLDVQLSHNAGKVTLPMFEEFQTNFKLALRNVTDASSEEIRRVLCEKFTPFMRKWVVEAEMKKMKNLAMVELTMREGLTVENVRATVAKWIGNVPRKIESCGGETFFVHFAEEKIARKLLEFHGRLLNGAEKKVKARLVEQHLTMDEIFSEVAMRMETQERTADLQKGSVNTEYRVHEADVHGEGKPRTPKNKTRKETPVSSPPSASAPLPQEPVGQGNGVNPGQDYRPPVSYREAVQRPPPVYQNMAPAYQWGTNWQAPQWGKGFQPKGGYGPPPNYGGKGYNNGYPKGGKGFSKGGNVTPNGGKGESGYSGKGGKGGRGKGQSAPPQGMVQSQ